jgi:hypothetical protein
MIYPNPATYVAKVRLNNKTQRDVSITLTNALGQVIESRILRNLSGETVIDYPLSNLTAGMYFLHFMVDGKAMSKILHVIK